MLLPKEFFFCFLLLVSWFTASAGDNTIVTNGNDTIADGLTRDESILFNMINDIRVQNKLKSIPLSRDLCTVAQTHIDDLIKWKPQDKGCSLQSWSGSGNWTSCCNTKELPGIECMKSKPREITGYKGDGYELIYWSEENAIPAEAAALWRDVDASADMILGRAKWSNFHWKAMGVGIKGGYAVLWLGVANGNNTTDNKDENVPLKKQPVAKDNSVSRSHAPETKTTNAEPDVKQKGATMNSEINSLSVNNSGSRYFIIVSSFKTAEAADIELKKIRINGYPAAFILEGETNFRVALAAYDNYDTATSRKNELKVTFPGIWVFKK